jgi:hypothetical protein
MPSCKGMISVSLRVGHYKDEILDSLAETANVAQFVSFAAGDPPIQRFSRIRNFPPNHMFGRPEDAISALLEHSGSKSVNIRSFDPLHPQANEFVYGLAALSAATAALLQLASSGLFTIVNETIDVTDGGVSGVLLDEIIEFAPEDTPRAVEAANVASFPRDLGVNVLRTVYGSVPSAPGPGVRVEFSLHPLRAGYRLEHVVTWETERVGRTSVTPDVRWPNRFSRFIGDKAFGLLIAFHLGVLVPATLVMPRRLAPFRFGTPTGTREIWMRTCPPEPVPGRFTTTHGWTDPFLLLAKEDLSGQEIASVLVQDAVPSEYSGATVTREDDTPFIEGVQGAGDAFMQGIQRPTVLPRAVETKVRALHAELSTRLGPIRYEWACDGENVWVLQLQLGSTTSRGAIIVPGNPTTDHRFNINDGLESLRSLVERIQGTDQGVVLVGDVGITSHFGDVLRRAGIPSRIEHLPTSEPGP